MRNKIRPIRPAKPRPQCQRPGCTKTCKRLERKYCSQTCYGLVISKANPRPRVTRTTGTRKLAAGTLKAGMRQTMIAFDPEMFEQIRDHAQANNTSFAEQVRTFVEWGLDEYEMEDAAD